MNIGITGSTGTLGSFLTKKIPNLIKFKGKIENKKLVEKWIIKENLDFLIHLAAIVPVKEVLMSKKKALTINFKGTKNIVDAINKYSNKKVWIFYSSTSHVYPYGDKIKKETDLIKPLNYYGITKQLSENYLNKNQDKIIPCIGRIFSFTHYTQKKDFVIPSIIKKLKNKKKNIYFDNLNHFRDFITINDIYLAIKILMLKKKKGIFNISSGNKICLKDILLTLNKGYGKKFFYKKNEVETVLYGSNKKLRKEGWKPLYTNYLHYLEKTKF